MVDEVLNNCKIWLLVKVFCNFKKSLVVVIIGIIGIKIFESIVMNCCNGDFWLLGVGVVVVFWL